MAITHLKSEKALFILCDHCFSVLTNVKRMQCTVCQIDLCIKCFKDGIKIRNHEYNHQYRIVDTFQFSIDNHWTALEQLLFIEGLSMLGIANWDDVADFIGTKSREEVETFFYKITEIDDNKDQESDVVANPQSNPNIHDIVSYMPFRKDFDVEYENDYESIFKELNNDNSLLPEHKKILQTELFTGFLNLSKMRNFKKFVILDKNLVNLKELQAVESNYSDIEISILNDIKPFAKFMSKEDFNTFYAGLSIEAELKRKIKEGVKTPQKSFLDIEKKRTAFLSDLEKEFCFNLKLSYKEYLKIKCKLITKQLENDHIDLEKCKAILNCYDSNVEEIYKFFKANEWIK